MAKELKGDDKKAAEGSNCRRAHHHITVMYEAMMWSMHSSMIIQVSHVRIPGKILFSIPQTRINSNVSG